jgi:hypothetical protein
MHLAGHAQIRYEADKHNEPNKCQSHTLNLIDARFASAQHLQQIGTQIGTGVLVF